MKDKVLTIIAAAGLVALIIIVLISNSSLFTLFILFCFSLMVPVRKSGRKEEKQSTRTE